jgi:hypothetical protein
VLPLLVLLLPGCDELRGLVVVLLPLLLWLQERLCCGHAAF